MREIPLTQGQVALVDDEDFDALSSHRWLAERATRRVWYAARGRPRRDGGGLIRMHAVLLVPPAGMVVDHIDGNGLNNQRSNLRSATRAQNVWHQGARQMPGATSAFKGVFWYKKTGQWRAALAGNCPKAAHRSPHLGMFDDEATAAHAYDAAAREYFGEFAVLNFPGD
jgi:hypothetical protein